MRRVCCILTVATTLSGIHFLGSSAVRVASESSGVSLTSLVWDEASYYDWRSDPFLEASPSVNMDALLSEAVDWAYRNGYSADYVYEKKDDKIRAPETYKGFEIDDELARKWMRGLAPVCKPSVKHPKRKRVTRPNHAIDTAVRKVMMVPFVVKAYERTHNFNEPLFPKLWEEHIFGIQLAALFDVSGRESELGFWDHPEIYLSFRNRSFQNLHSFLDASPRAAALVHKQVDAEVCGKATVLDRVLDGLRNMYRKNLYDKTNTHIKTILEMLHDLELVRCFGGKDTAPKMQAKYDNEMTEHLGDFLKDLLTLTSKMMFEMGAQVQWSWDENARKRFNYDCRLFSRVANDGGECLSIAKKILPDINSFNGDGCHEEEDLGPPPKYFGLCERDVGRRWGQAWPRWK